MLFERIEAKGLAQNSYLIGDRGEAVVVDPRRDCEAYVDLAARAGMRITRIFETHRNEDYAVGSTELAARTGAEIWHADAQLDYKYGEPAGDGQDWPVGRLTIRALHTPGHTPGSMSYLLCEAGGEPWTVFTGDTLFAGDVGRCDLVDANRTEEMARTLYETLHRKLLPLGDEVIVCPGHGAGSVCGVGIAERTVTTIGIEKRRNPKLAFADEDAFVAGHARVMHRPPYFRRMEVWNTDGAPPLGAVPRPAPLAPADFAARAAGGAVVLDTRSELSFAGGHVPGALGIYIDNVPAFAGWLLPYDTPILLVSEGDDGDTVVRYLLRMGYDDVAGCLAGGMLAWHTAAQPSQAIATVTVAALCESLDAGADVQVLDVRTDEEVATDGAITGALQIDARDLPERLAEVPRDKPLQIFCGVGLRSMMAASLLQRAGYEDLRVTLGGLIAWNSASCPVKL